MRTVMWKQGQVLIADQRKLPKTFEYKECCSYRDVAAAIKDMLIRGAPAIGVAAAYGMALAAREFCGLGKGDFFRNMGEASKEIGSTRPTAVNLFWAIEEIEKIISQNSHKEPEYIFREILNKAERMAEEDIETNRRIGDWGAGLIPSPANILTHCNTGSLATVGFGTALGVVRAAHGQGKNIHVFIDETRPRLQGARLTAYELMQERIPSTLIPDSASGLLMKNRRIDLVIVGADRIALNGDTANKIGTYNIAVIAYENNIPFYIAAPIATIDFGTEKGEHIEIEERDKTEVTHIEDIAIAPEGVNVYNPSFDVTPAMYITAIITEEGIIQKPFGDKLRNIKKKKMEGDSP